MKAPATLRAGAPAEAGAARAGGRDLPTEVLALTDAVDSPRLALSLVALRFAEDAGFLPQGRCAWLAKEPWATVAQQARVLRLRTGGALPPRPLPVFLQSVGRKAAARFLAGPGGDALSLSGAAEALLARSLGAQGRRDAGVYFTPPEVAARVVELGLSHGNVEKHGIPCIVDPCAGAGAFLGAAARALTQRGTAAHLAALACAGADLDASALDAARATLALLAGSEATAMQLEGLRLRRGDSLARAHVPPADLLVSNPPYGRITDPAERAKVLARLPALRGGEPDRYAAFLLRSLALVRPGGTIALLLPDTWMTNSRGGGVRGAILEEARLAAVVDLGKPFAAARDTRVQAVVLVRKDAREARGAPEGDERAGQRTWVGRAAGSTVAPLAPLALGALLEGVRAGWQPYRTEGERELCDALERAAVPLATVCSVGYGLRTGDNGLHVQRRPPAAGEAGLLGGEDIVPFAVRWRAKTLCAPTPALAKLVQRQLGRPRVAIQRIRTNAAAPWARWLEGALAPAQLVCLDSLSTLACDDEELLYALLALVGSVAWNRFHRLRTTDVNVKPSLLGGLPVPRSLLVPGGAAQLARLARERAVEAAREAARDRDAPAPLLERRIDAAVYAAFGLPARLVDVAERGFWGARLPAEQPRLRD